MCASNSRVASGDCLPFANCRATSSSPSRRAWHVTVSVIWPSSASPATRDYVTLAIPDSVWGIVRHLPVQLVEHAPDRNRRLAFGQEPVLVRSPVGRLQRVLRRQLQPVQPLRLGGDRDKRLTKCDELLARYCRLLDESMTWH